MARQQQVPTSEHKRNRLWLIVTSIVLLLVVGTLVSANVAASQNNAAASSAPTAGAGSDKSEATSSATPSGPATGSATPVPTPAPDPGKSPIVEPTPPAEFPPLAFTESASPSAGLVFSVSALEAVQGVARGPGEVAGPALRFALTIRNDTAESVSLESTVVNLYFGADQSPATDLQEPGGVALPADVTAGNSVTGVFIFAVPKDEREQIKIAVDYSVALPIVVFEGRAPR
jgi:hypothetical protein